MSIHCCFGNVLPYASSTAVDQKRKNTGKSSWCKVSKSIEHIYVCFFSMKARPQALSEIKVFSGVLDSHKKLYQVDKSHPTDKIYLN